MQFYFGHATGQAGDKSRAGDDADGDGFTNLEEFKAHTDPRNPASALRIMSILRAADGACHVRERCRQIVSPGMEDFPTNSSWSMAVDNIAGREDTVTVIDSRPSVCPQRFYRIVAID